MKKYISSIVFFLFSASMLLGQGPYYINLDDASGFDRSPYEAQLEAAAAEIIEILPEEYKTQFKVFDFGFYLHNENFSEGVEHSLDHAKSLAAAQSPYYLLFAKQTDQTGLYSRFYIEVELPRTAPDYPCVKENLSELIKTLTSISTQTHYESTGKIPSSYALSEIQGMAKFISKVYSVFNCCGESENITCSAFGNNREEANILASKFIKPDERFIELKNIKNIQITPQSYSNILSEKKIIFDIEIKDDQTNAYSKTGYNLTDSLNNIALINNNINEFDVNVIYMDDSSYSEELLGNLVGSPDQTNNAPPPVVDGTIYEPSSYYEEIIVLDLNPDSLPIILSRITVEYEVAQVVNGVGPGDPRDEELAEFILPVIAVKIGQVIIRRAFMASLNVGINIGMTVAIEKVWGHDDCTWGQAFWAAKITGWHLVIWTTEGFLSGGNPVKDIIIGGVAAAAEYVFTAPPDNFQITKVFSTFATGVVLGGAFNFLGTYIGKAYGRYFKKVDDEGGNLLKLTSESFLKASDEFFDAKYFTKNIEDGFFDGLYRWFRSVDALRDFATLNNKGWSIDLMQQFKKQFPDINNPAIRDGITEVAEGTTERAGFLRYCIDGLGCFVKNTPVLMANNPFKNVATGVALAALPLVAPIQNIQVDDMVKAYHHEEMYLTTSTNEDDVYVPGWQAYDYLDITPETWQVGKFVITEEDGSKVEIEANRPIRWFEECFLKRKGDKIHLEIPELGVSGKAELQSIYATTIDTRSFALNGSGQVDRPVITTYKRLTQEVWDYTFSNGQVISCTPNHPFYSSDQQEFIPIGELTFGEIVQTAGEREVKFISGKSREKGEHVYNFEVWREHNYYVGFEENEDFVLTHNTDCWDVWLKNLKNLEKSVDDIQDLSDKTWAKKLDNSLQQKEIDAMESLGGKLEESIVGLTDSYPGIDAVSQKGKIITLKHSTGTMSAVEKLLKEMTDKVDKHDQGFSDVIGVITAKSHPTSTIISKIDDIIDKKPSRYSKFEKILIEGLDGEEWYIF